MPHWKMLHPHSPRCLNSSRSSSSSPAHGRDSQRPRAEPYGSLHRQAWYQLAQYCQGPPLDTLLWTRLYTIRHNQSSSGPSSRRLRRSPGNCGSNSASNWSTILDLACPRSTTSPHDLQPITTNFSSPSLWCWLCLLNWTARQQILSRVKFYQMMPCQAWWSCTSDCIPLKGRLAATNTPQQ